MTTTILPVIVNQPNWSSFSEPLQFIIAIFYLVIDVLLIGMVVYLFVDDFLNRRRK